jgi:hypothetical protein
LVTTALGDIDKAMVQLRDANARLRHFKFHPPTLPSQ